MPEVMTLPQPILDQLAKTEAASQAAAASDAKVNVAKLAKVAADEAAAAAAAVVDQKKAVSDAAYDAQRAEGDRLIALIRQHYRLAA